LGGTWNLPHAETHTIVLPHAMAYNERAAPDAMARIARALNARSAPLGLYGLAQQLKAPLALKDIGFPESAIDEAARLAVTNPYYNPRPVQLEPIRELLRRAWAGLAPAA